MSKHVRWVGLLLVLIIIPLAGYVAIAMGADKPPAAPATPAAPAAPAPAADEPKQPEQPKQAEKVEEEIPPAPGEFMGRRTAHTMHWLGADWLTRTERDREEGVTVLEKEIAKKLKSGMAACDLGCGNGFWTLRLSKMVGDKGKVFGVDIQPEMLDMLKERAKEAGVTNVQPILNNQISTKLPDESCDLILLVDVYHEFSHPQQMLDSMRKALKPGGYLVLVEYRMEDPEVPIKLDHKMSKEQIKKEYLPNGFKLVEEFDELPWQHVMYFQRDDKKQP